MLPLESNFNAADGEIRAKIYMDTVKSWDLPKKCATCEKYFTPTRWNQKYCCSDCGASFGATENCSTSRGNTGDVCEYYICCDLMLKKWYVYKHVGTNSPFDIYIYRDGEAKRVEVKAGRVNSTTGRMYYSSPKNNEYDVLAVYNLNTSETFYFDADGNAIDEELE